MKGRAMPTKAVYIPFIKRIHYFSGQLLTERDFSVEQHYLIEKRRLLNRNMLNWGIVAGLHVSVGDGSHAVTVAPGMALDGHGREIILLTPATLALPKIGLCWWLVVKYAERRTDPVPVAADGIDSLQPSRIEEGVEISYDSENPCDQKMKNDAVPEYIAIAKLTWKRNGWRIAKRLPCPLVRTRR